MKKRWLIFVKIVCVLLFILNFVNASGIIENNSYIANDFNHTLGIKKINTLDLYVKNSTWLEFDGIDDYVEIPGREEYSITKTGKLSILYYIENKDNLKYNFIFGKGGMNNSPFEWGINTNNFNSTGMTVWDKYGATKESISSSANSVPLYLWKYVSFSVSDGVFLYSYINGDFSRAANNIDSSKLIKSSNSSLIIGNRRLNIDNYFKGNIKNIIIFNESLNSIQIKEFYNNISKQKTQYLPIFMLHRVCPNLSVQDTCILNTTLIFILEKIKKLNYTCITDIDLYNWSRGYIEIPKRSILFTFDDGHDDTMEIAKIMSLYDCPSVAGINVGNLNAPTYLKWKNVTDLVQIYNWSIASHSVLHCYHGSNPNAPYNLYCNSSDSRRGNMSKSKEDIIKYTNFTPISYIFPSNVIGINNIEREIIISDCRDFYDICFGGSVSIKYPIYMNRNTNISNGDLIRIEIVNNTAIQDIINSINYIVPKENIIGEWRLNEGQGDMIYDRSINHINGTIHGPTWNNDGINIKLKEGFDYRLYYGNRTNPAIVEILNSDILNSEINVILNYTSYKSFSSLSDYCINSSLNYCVNNTIVKMIECVNFTCDNETYEGPVDESGCYNTSTFYEEVLMNCGLYGDVCYSGKCIGCASAPDCDDFDPFSEDICIDAGIENSSCMHLNITCFSDIDCGESTYSGSKFCLGNDSYISVRSPKCLYPGNESSKCILVSNSRLYERCGFICENGICYNQSLDDNFCSVSFPIENMIYNNFLTPIKVNSERIIEKIELFEDSTMDFPIILCGDCQNYYSQYIFYEGFHNISIKCTGYSNKIDENNILFYTDYKSPQILQTFPTKDKFSNGSDFIVVYNENNIIKTRLNVSGLVFNKQCTSGQNKKCLFDVNVKTLDSKTVNYSFSLKDITNKTTNSKPISIKIDTTSPVIWSYSIEKGIYYHNFKINIFEKNLKTVGYYDYSLKSPYFVNLCYKLVNGLCSKNIRLLRGNHNFSIIAIDQSGNSQKIDNVIVNV